MIAAQSRTAVLPAPLTPANTFTWSANSNRRSRIPLKWVSARDLSFMQYQPRPNGPGRRRSRDRSRHSSTNLGCVPVPVRMGRCNVQPRAFIPGGGAPAPYESRTYGPGRQCNTGCRRGIDLSQCGHRVRRRLHAEGGEADEDSVVELGVGVEAQPLADLVDGAAQAGAVDVESPVGGVTGVLVDAADRGGVEQLCDPLRRNAPDRATGPRGSRGPGSRQSWRSPRSTRPLRQGDPSRSHRPALPTAAPPPRDRTGAPPNGTAAPSAFFDPPFDRPPDARYEELAQSVSPPTRG